MRSPTRDPDSIRPGLLALAAAFFGAAALLIAMLVSHTEGASDASVDGEGPDREEGGRRVVLMRDEDPADLRVTDPGARGSVREAWAEAYAEPDPMGGQLPPLVEAIADPQMSAFHRSFDREAELPFRPTARRGHITSGGLGLRPGTSCDVRVLPVGDASFNCVVRVTCGDVVVYPNHAQTAGFVACELDGTTPRRAFDRMPSTDDGDPAVSMDLDSGHVAVSDRTGEGSYHVVIELDPTPIRVM